ncbi:hypothetical protein [Streptomyces sp. NPDC127190]|uniref:hypothetical protein n=1 Tax=unclassified Streptomyces TaxID=2593676 RepID=UPI003626EBAE
MYPEARGPCLCGKDTARPGACRPREPTFAARGCVRSPNGFTWAARWVVCLLAIATNLSEIAITVSAAMAGQLVVAVGNLLGGIAIQTIAPAVLDAARVRPRAPLTRLAASLQLVLEEAMVDDDLPARPVPARHRHLRQVGPAGRARHRHLPHRPRVSGGPVRRWPGAARAPVHGCLP